MRFPGFTDDWKKTTLGEITTNFNLRNKEQIDYPMFSVTNNRGFIPQSEQFEDREMKGEDIKAYKVIHHNDFAYNPARINVGSIAKYNGYEPCMISSLYVCFKANNEVNEDWLMHLLRTPKVQYYYQLNGEGGVRIYLFYPNFARIRTSIPSIEEQKKIAKILSIIDERIATQNKIIEDLKKLKSAIVDNLMTPQKDWESTKIVNVLSIGSGRDYKHLRDGNIPVYGTGGYMLSVDSYLYDGESVCIGRKGTINKPIFLKGKFWTVDTLFYTHTFRSITPRFCYYLFTTIDWLKYNEASGVPSLSKVTIENISISIPDLVTQKQICAVLDSMTDKLDIEQKLLDAYHAQKQYLLQQIFI